MQVSSMNFPLMFMTFSLHVGAIGIFLLVVKTTIWDDSSLMRKAVILGVLYFTYAFLVGPNVEGFSRSVLGMPSHAEEQAQEEAKTRIPGVLPNENIP
jgi:hypothetical protein